MAFALAFCPGIVWIIIKFQDVATTSFYIPVIDINYSIWRIFLLICASLNGLTSVGLLFLTESPRYLLAHDRHDEAVQVMQTIYKRNNGNSTETYPIKSIELDNIVDPTALKLTWTQKIYNQTVPLFLQPHGFNTLRTSFLMFSLFAASSGFFMWVPEILSKLIKQHHDVTVCEIVPDIFASK